MKAERWGERRLGGWGIAVAALLVVALAFGGVSAAGDNKAGATKPSAAAESTGPKPIPKDVLADFVRAVKETDDYRLCRALDAETVKKAAEEWEKKLGVKIDVEPQDFLENSEHSQVTLSDGTQVMLNWKGGWERPWVLEAREGRGGRWTPLFTVSRDELNDLHFEYVPGVGILDPANRPIQTFDARGDLVDIVGKLCEMGRLDSSMRGDLEGRISVNLNLRNKSAATCLRLAARAAGFNVVYATERGESIGQYIADRNVSIRDALGTSLTWSPDLKPIDALREEIFRRAEWMLKDRPVMVLEPPRESEGEKEQGEGQQKAE